MITGAGKALLYPVIVVQHGEPSNMQQAIQGCITLFFSLKIVYGFASDYCPILGYRRKSYLLLGWAIAILSSLVLALMASLGGSSMVCMTNSVKVPCDGQQTSGPFPVTNLSVATLVSLMMANNFGVAMADVAMDSRAMELAQTEENSARGSVQGHCYTLRALGTVLSFVVTGIGMNGPLYDGGFSFEMNLSTYLWLLVLLQCIGVPWWLRLPEEKVAAPVCRQSALKSIWCLLQNASFAKVLVFFLFYEVCNQCRVAARTSVLHSWVSMSPLAYSLDQGLQNLVALLTIFGCARWFRLSSWRGLMVATAMYSVAFMMLFWLVVYDVVRNQWFVLFVDIDFVFAQNVAFLVVVWYAAETSPPGMEGVSFSLASTMGNSGAVLGNYVTMGLSGCFQLDAAALNRDDATVRDQYMYNSLAVMALKVAFLAFLAWLPAQRRQAKEDFTARKSSTVWAAVAVLLACFGVLWGAVCNVAGLSCSCARILGGEGCSHGCSP